MSFLHKDEPKEEPKHELKHGSKHEPKAPEPPQPLVLTRTEAERLAEFLAWEPVQAWAARQYETEPLRRLAAALAEGRGVKVH